MTKISIIHDNECYWSGTIDDNCKKFAGSVGVLTVIWEPDSLGLKECCDFLEPLGRGLKTLCKGDFTVGKDGLDEYIILFTFVRKYLMACVENPEFIVEVTHDS